MNRISFHGNSCVRGTIRYSLQWRVSCLRHLPVAMRGKARLARWMLGDLSREGPCEIRHREGIWIEVPGFGDSISFFLLIDGVYEPRELDWLDRLAEPGSWVVDVGANVGALALPLARRRTDLGGVLAVEASPPIAAMLARSGERNALESVVVVHAAAGAGEGEIWFDGSAPGAFGQGHVASGFASGRVRVGLRTIDSLVSERGIDHVSIMKIDVEGYERDVLEGATALLAAQTPVGVLFEFYGPPGEPIADEARSAQHLLVDRGFRLFSLRQGGGVAELESPVSSGFHTLLALRRDDARLARLDVRSR